MVNVNSLWIHSLILLIYYANRAVNGFIGCGAVEVHGDSATEDRLTPLPNEGSKRWRYERVFRTYLSESAFFVFFYDVPRSFA